MLVLQEPQHIIPEVNSQYVQGYCVDKNLTSLLGLQFTPWLITGNNISNY